MNEIGNKDFKNEVADVYTNPEKFKEVRDDYGKHGVMIDKRVLPILDALDVEKCTGPKVPDDRELAGSPYDMVNHPQHYKTGKIECIDCISAVVNMYDGEQAYDVGQVIKYLYRAPTKMNFMQDLKKAQWYLNRLIEVASKTNK